MLHISCSNFKIMLNKFNPNIKEFITVGYMLEEFSPENPEIIKMNYYYFKV